MLTVISFSASTEILLLAETGGCRLCSNPNASYSAEKVEVRCTRKPSASSIAMSNLRFLSSSSHSGSMAKGKILNTYSAADPWGDIPPDSVAERALTLVCAK